MGIKRYEVEEAPGITKVFYQVVAEGINKYTGKRIQKKCMGITSQVKAERIHREIWSQCREERPDGPLVKTWGELKDKYFGYVERNIRTKENINGFSPRVVNSKRSRFIYLKHWDSRHLDLMNAMFVKEELDRLEKQGIASRALTVEIQKAVSAIFSYAVDSGILTVHPLSNLKRKGVKKKKMALTHVEANTLLREARARNHPYFFVWLLTLILGLRRSELAGLKWADIDFENGLVSLCRQLHPKEGLVEKLKDNEDRIVAIPTYAIPILKEYRLRAMSEFVIELDCGRWKAGHQAEVVKAFCREIGIKEITHHQLRTTHITLAINDGVPVGIVKDNVGHSKLSTTDGYYASSGVHLRGQTDRLRIEIPIGLEGEVSQLKAAN